MFSLQRYIVLSGIVFCIVSGLFLQSCEKAEAPIVLPPNSGARHSRVDLGQDYNGQIYFNVEDTVQAGTSRLADWDLCFDASPEGFHVFMNGGRQVFLYNTGATAFGAITVLPAGIPETEWLLDDPAGGSAGSGVGAWQAGGVTKGEVYIVRMGSNSDYRKIRFVSVTPGEYVVETGLLSATQPTPVTLPKDDRYNFAYYSFTAGPVQAEPMKNQWDILFTHYRHIYKNLDNFPYYVTGVLLNPSGVTAAADSAGDFAEMTVARAEGLTYSAARDVIGFDWKTYNFTAALYETNPRKVYVVKTRNGQLWKLHFLSFYNEQGVKGSPAFEYTRLR